MVQWFQRPKNRGHFPPFQENCSPILSPSGQEDSFRVYYYYLWNNYYYFFGNLWYLLVLYVLTCDWIVQLKCLAGIQPIASLIGSVLEKNKLDLSRDIEKSFKPHTNLFLFLTNQAQWMVNDWMNTFPPFLLLSPFVLCTYQTEPTEQPLTDTHPQYPQQAIPSRRI